IIKLIAADTQPARNDIKADQHAGMAKMAEIVYCHAAHIHAHTLWFDGFEGLFFASQGVINVQHAPGCDQRVKSWAVSITSACLARPAGTVFFRHPFYGSYVTYSAVHQADADLPGSRGLRFCISNQPRSLRRI